MSATSVDKKWFDELTVELRMRDVPGAAIGDTVASARELLADTGQSAEEAFGSARSYAAALELPRQAGPGWASRGMWPSLLGVLAFLIFVQASAAWAQSEPFRISAGQVVLLGGIGGLVALLPVYLRAAMRRPWLLGVLVLIGGGIGLLSAVAAEAPAWVSLNPVPWMLCTAVVMILLSVWNTVKTLQRGNTDEITDPLAAMPARPHRGHLGFRLFVSWIFPVFAVIALGLVLVLAL